jgi:hypothetical protein
MPDEQIVDGWTGGAGIASGVVRGRTGGFFDDGVRDESANSDGGVGVVAGAVLLSGSVDAVLREMAKVPGSAKGSYARRMTVVMFVAGALLVGAVVVFLGLIAVGVAKALR